MTGSSHTHSAVAVEHKDLRSGITSEFQSKTFMRNGISVLRKYFSAMTTQLFDSKRTEPHFTSDLEF